MKIKSIIVCVASLVLTLSVCNVANINKTAILVNAEETSDTETTYTDVSEFTFTFDKENNTATLTGYKESTGGAVVIPPSVNGYTITAIGIRAFYDKSISSVTIPNTVTTIGESAFYYCSNLLWVVQ